MAAAQNVTEFIMPNDLQSQFNVFLSSIVELLKKMPDTEQQRWKPDLNGMQSVFTNSLKQIEILQANAATLRNAAEFAQEATSNAYSIAHEAMANLTTTTQSLNLSQQQQQGFLNMIGTGQEIMQRRRGEYEQKQHGRQHGRQSVRQHGRLPALQAPAPAQMTQCAVSNCEIIVPQRYKGGLPVASYCSTHWEQLQAQAQASADQAEQVSGAASATQLPRRQPTQAAPVESAPSWGDDMVAEIGAQVLPSRRAASSRVSQKLP